VFAKIILNVAFAEREIVKKMGARWDPAHKVWYLLPGMDPKPFARWMVESPKRDKVSVSQLGLIRNMMACWSCKGYVTICAVFARQCLEKQGLFILYDISFLPDSIESFLKRHCPHFRLGKVNAAGYLLYRNHCDHCRQGLSDAVLHQLGGALNPKTVKDCKLVELIDLMFYETLLVEASVHDYSDNHLLQNHARVQDYLLDFV
jgi:hypothetical protein